MSDLRCRFGWHQWADWSKLVASQYERPVFTISGYGGTSYTTTKTVEFTVFEQERTCLGCGRIQRQEARRE